MFVLPQNDRSRHLAIFRRAYFLLNRCELLLIRTRGQHVAAVLRQSRENLCHLRGGLPLAENHLWHARTQAAMVVHLGESKIFKWQMPQSIHRVIGSKFPLANLVE